MVLLDNNRRIGKLVKRYQSDLAAALEPIRESDELYKKKEAKY